MVTQKCATRGNNMAILSVGILGFLWIRALVAVLGMVVLVDGFGLQQQTNRLGNDSVFRFFHVGYRNTDLGSSHCSAASRAQPLRARLVIRKAATDHHHNDNHFHPKHCKTTKKVKNKQKPRSLSFYLPNSWSRSAVQLTEDEASRQKTTVLYGKSNWNGDDDDVNNINGSSYRKPNNRNNINGEQKYYGSDGEKDMDGLASQQLTNLVDQLILLFTRRGGGGERGGSSVVQLLPPTGYILLWLALAQWAPFPQFVMTIALYIGSFLLVQQVVLPEDDDELNFSSSSSNTFRVNGQVNGDSQHKPPSTVKQPETVASIRNDEDDDTSSSLDMVDFSCFLASLALGAILTVGASDEPSVVTLLTSATSSQTTTTLPPVFGAVSPNNNASSGGNGSVLVLLCSSLVAMAGFVISRSGDDGGGNMFRGGRDPWWNNSNGEINNKNDNNASSSSSSSNQRLMDLWDDQFFSSTGSSSHTDGDSKDDDGNNNNGKSGGSSAPPPRNDTNNPPPSSDE